MKKILITGASGFIGYHLVIAAKERGLEVHAAVRTTSNIKAITPVVDKFVYLDLTDAEALQRVFEKEQYHYIIHAVALTKAKDEKSMLDVNVGYTERILHAAFNAQAPLERVSYVSSLAALGPTDYQASVLMDERTPYRPLTVYGRSKHAAEMMIREKFSDKAISVFRPTAVYGPREKDIFLVFETMNRGLDLYIGGKPQWLSFIYVKDLVDVLLQGCIHPQEGLQFYNITDGEVYSRYKMSEVFREVFRKKMWRVHVPLGLVKAVANISQRLYKNSLKTPVIYPERIKELTAENWGCDISKAKDILGFSPSYDLEKGLKETLLWYKENNWL